MTSQPNLSEYAAPAALPQLLEIALPYATEGRMKCTGSRWTRLRSRRLFDCSVAGIALIASLPLMLLAAALVKASSPGPVLFRQRRVGRNGEEFTLFKFRSMREAPVPGSPITILGDSRVTRVGMWLRRFKLDELPQFWHVLKGDMSMVGPRPKLPHHEGLHMPYRPGITGVATLAFRREEEFLQLIPEAELDLFYEAYVKPAKALLDSEYMECATFWSDVKLLWQTATACLCCSDDPVPFAIGHTPRQARPRAESAQTLVEAMED